MNDSTVHYPKRVVLSQIGMSLAAFGATALLAPLLLLFDADLWSGVVAALAKVAALAIVVGAVSTIVRLRSHRFALRALSLQSDSIDAEDLRRLDALPASTTYTFFAAGALASLLILAPGLRPKALDDGRTASLVVLAITLLSAAAIPHYVLARRATLHLVELCPIETATALLEEGGPPMARRVRQRILLSVVAPVMLVGAGAVLLAHAHLRTFLEESRKATAAAVARAALDSDAGPGSAFEEALRAARERGFAVTIAQASPGDREELQAGGVVLSRAPDGTLAASVPLTGGVATARFAADPDAGAIASGVLVALLATLLAAALAHLFGREMARDLERATAHVRVLAGQGDLRSASKPGGAARFDVVERLEEAIETLTERFRMFSVAQERALGARETAQRVRGLLFASVSHDLKSPLNAILGFADLLANEQLTAAQAESLDLIRTRGRELLGLIETILDAARVEAGQLKLAPRPVPLEWLLPEAARKAADLIGEDVSEPLIDAGVGLPSAVVDPTHGARAIAVILAHALRLSASDPNARAVRVQANGARGDRVSIDVIYGSRDGAAEIGALVGAPPAARARGLILGLALSRRVIELHQGEVAVDTLPDGRAVCRVLFPAGQADLPLPRAHEQPA